MDNNQNRQAMNDETPALQQRSADEKLRAISSAFEMYKYARKDCPLQVTQLMAGLIKDIHQILTPSSLRKENAVNNYHAAKDAFLNGKLKIEKV